MVSENQTIEIDAPSLPQPWVVSTELKNSLVITAALLVGAIIWKMPPAGAMDTTGMHFLATMVVAITLWVLDVFDEYVVGLMLLLVWVVCGVASTKIALAGFSENSWFFTIGALGMAAAIGHTTLLQRFSFRLLRWIPIRCQKVYTLLLLSAGVLSGPLLPTGKARAAVAVPISQSISQASGFEPRSNGAAIISLSAFVGFSQMSFMFLTGGDQCLIGWNFLPPEIKAEFGWLSWFVVALPAAAFISLFMFFAVHFLLPLSRAEKERLDTQSMQAPVNGLGPISRHEWVTVCTLIMTIGGWLTKSVHGINEAWVALAALLVFLLTGVLDKQRFKNQVDWSLILFFGVLNSMAIVAENAKADAWLMSLGAPLLARFAHQPLIFLLIICLLVSGIRFVLRKTPAAALFAVTVMPLSNMSGIHPGVLIVTGIMAGECFLLTYQDGPYQIAYGGTGGKAFSHAQARRVLAAKYIATLLGVAVSVPYWKYLGFIR